jgi:hypothetical protein
MAENENDPVLTTATVSFFANDGLWTEHQTCAGTTYTANSNNCLLRLYSRPCPERIAMDLGPTEQIQFRVGASIVGRRAPGWEWERRDARRLLFIFDEADVVACPRPQRPEDAYDACFRDNPQMWS